MIRDVRFPILNAMRDRAPRWVRGAFDARAAVKAWDENKVKRGKTKEGTNDGSFAPKELLLRVREEDDIETGNFRVKAFDGKTQVGEVALRGFSTLDIGHGVAKNSWTITNILVRQDLQRRGYGTQIYRQLYKLAREHKKRLYMSRTQTAQGRAFKEKLEQRGWMRGNEIVFSTAQKSFDPSKHPRQPAGSDKGGEFAPKGGVPLSANVGEPADVVAAVKKAGARFVSEFRGSTMRQQAYMITPRGSLIELNANTAMMPHERFAQTFLGDEGDDGAAQELIANGWVHITAQKDFATNVAHDNRDGLAYLRGFVERSPHYRSYALQLYGGADYSLDIEDTNYDGFLEGIDRIFDAA